MVRTRVEDCERYVAKKRLVLVRNRLLHRLANSLKGRGATIALVSRGWKSGHLFWRWKQTHRAGRQAWYLIRLGSPRAGLYRARIILGGSEPRSRKEVLAVTFREIEFSRTIQWVTNWVEWHGRRGAQADPPQCPDWLVPCTTDRNPV